MARRLGVTRRTLFAWRMRIRGGAVRTGPAGRPVAALDRSTSDLVLDLLREVGPDVGIPALRTFLPWAPRAALKRALRHYRLGHRRRRLARLYRLRWTRPGSVWALDLAYPPHPKGGIGRFALAVRDLASRKTLAWTPLARGTAEAVVPVVHQLVRRLGAPLVLKSDNGSSFIAPLFRTLLARHGIVHLRSPRAWPQYNGACEAGIGLLRALTDQAAARRGRWDFWTIEDLEEARERANDLAQNRGRGWVRVEEVWRTRIPILSRERRRFRMLLEKTLLRLKREDPKHRRHPQRIRRKAIQATLVELGFLMIRSGWIPARKCRKGSGPSYR